MMKTIPFGNDFYLRLRLVDTTTSGDAREMNLQDDDADYVVDAVTLIGLIGLRGPRRNAAEIKAVTEDGVICRVNGLRMGEYDVEMTGHRELSGDSWRAVKRCSIEIVYSKVEEGNETQYEDGTPVIDMELHVEVLGVGDRIMQADWAIEDETRPDFIKNKPDTYTKQAVNSMLTQLRTLVNGDTDTKIAALGTLMHYCGDLDFFESTERSALYTAKKGAVFNVPFPFTYNGVTYPMDTFVMVKSDSNNPSRFSERVHVFAQDLSKKADKSNTYTKAEVDAALREKADLEEVEQSMEGKVDKEEGKGLSENDFTTEEKNKLARLQDIDLRILEKQIGTVPSTLSEILAAVDSNGHYEGNIGEVATWVKGGYYSEVSVDAGEVYQYSFRELAGGLPYYMIFLDDENVILGYAAPGQGEAGYHTSDAVVAPEGTTKAIVMSQGGSMSQALCKLCRIEYKDIASSAGFAEEALKGDSAVWTLPFGIRSNTATSFSPSRTSLAMNLKKDDVFYIQENIGTTALLYVLDDTPTQVSDPFNLIDFAQLKSTGRFLIVPEDYDGKCLLISSTSLTGIRLWLNGEKLADGGMISKANSIFALKKFYHVGLRGRYPVPDLMMEAGTGSSPSATSYARIKYAVLGRCEVVLDDDYIMAGVQIVGNKLNSPTRNINSIGRIVGTEVREGSCRFTFDYDGSVKFWVRRRDLGTIDSSEYPNIVKSIRYRDEDYPNDSRIAFSPCEIKTYSLQTEDVRNFMSNVNYDNSDYSYTLAPEYYKLNSRFECCLPVPIDWLPITDAIKYAVQINEDNTVYWDSIDSELHVDGSKCHLDVYNLLPGKTYSYEVKALLRDGTSILIAHDSFNTSGDCSVRILNLPDVTNARDLGGWSGMNDKRVKYGKIFRSAALSRRQGYIITDEGVEIASRILDIGKEIGLGVSYNSAALSETTAFIDIPVSGYAAGLTNSGANYVLAFEEIIKSLKGVSSAELQPDESAAHSVLFHCAGGADRTGTMSFLLLGLLGVSESDLAKEYELTSFSRSRNARVRNTQNQYKGMIDYVKTTYPESTLNESIYDWWIAQGLTSAQISEFRDLMLE